MGSNGGESGRDYHKRKKAGGGGANKAAQAEEQTKAQATQQSHPETITINETITNPKGDTVQYDEYLKQLKKSPIPPSSREEVKDAFGGSEKLFAMHALNYRDGEDRMNALGITKPMYYYKDLARAWYTGLSKLVHPDNNNGSEASKKAFAKLNRLYHGMVDY